MCFSECLPFNEYLPQCRRWLACLEFHIHRTGRESRSHVFDLQNSFRAFDGTESEVRPSPSVGRRALFCESLNRDAEVILE